MPKVKMLRSLATKPDAAEKDQRYEGHAYEVSKEEARDLISKGLAVDPSSEDAFALVVDAKGERHVTRMADVPSPASDTTQPPGKPGR